MDLTERFLDALNFSLDLNRDRVRRRSQTPYIAHLLAVAAIVLEHGGDEDQTIAALLLDAAEGSGGVRILIEIRRRFGERVTRIVQGCSDSVLNTGQERAAWKSRKSEFIASIKGKSADVVLVCLADKIHNARSVLSDYRMFGNSVWQRFKGDKEGTLWYYRAMVEAFKPITKGLLAQSILVQEFDDIVREIEKLV
jgi:(p)ppGpp synthase/HD superfamily hydrolase